MPFWVDSLSTTGRLPPFFGCFKGSQKDSRPGFLGRPRIVHSQPVNVPRFPSLAPLLGRDEPLLSFVVQVPWAGAGVERFLFEPGSGLLPGVSPQRV